MGAENTLVCNKFHLHGANYSEPTLAVIEGSKTAPPPSAAALS